MSLTSLVIGGALILAAYAFHWRARLLGDGSHGWPAAPPLIRWALDGAALPLLVAGLWQVTAGRLPGWLVAWLAVALAAYALVFAINISRQRAGPETAAAVAKEAAS